MPSQVRPDCGGLAYECLSVVVRDPRALGPASYMPLLEASLQFITRYKQVCAEQCSALLGGGACIALHC